MNPKPEKTTLGSKVDDGGDGIRYLGFWMTGGLIVWNYGSRGTFWGHGINLFGFNVLNVCGKRIAHPGEREREEREKKRKKEASDMGKIGNEKSWWW